MLEKAEENPNSGLSWPSAFLADAEALAPLVFVNAEHARSLLRALSQSLSIVRRLTRPDPYHSEWRRIAIIIEMLVSDAYHVAGDVNTKSALRRLNAFIEENADLLDFSFSRDKSDRTKVHRGV
jgi:hypothetical protein